MWARRAVYRLGGLPILVQEVFLPELLRVQASARSHTEEHTMTADSLPFAVPRPTVEIAGSVRALSRAPHLLRRPQLRGARARDGHRIRARAAVLLHQACRRRGAERLAGALSAAHVEPAPRDRTRRRDRQGRPAYPGRRGARARVRLCGRQRPDASRPADRMRRTRAALGRREGLRSLGARSPRSVRVADGRSPRRRGASGSRSTASRGRTPTCPR